MENYIVSARKYRPLNFESVVGQKALTQTLQNAIRQNHLAHAYLFCGPRGVGKTTCARIFAKTINCLNPSSGHDACNECESCRAFNEGRSFNIHELDAASNNSVEDIRSLIDQVRIPPQIGKYSVYIIDEVHMLSTGAFNALLKTLEEPPSYAIFILATTEKHKVLPTILSRCQVYDFARITIADTIAHLQHVAQQEGVNASEEALNVVAQKADGGMRDALSIFDQLVSFCGNTITYERTIEVLNVLDSDYYFRMVDFALAHDVTGAMLLLNEVLQKGFDAGNFTTGLAQHLRDVLVAKDPQTITLLETADTIRRHYAAQAQHCSPQWLFAALDILNTCDINYRTAKNKRLTVELALIRMTQLGVQAAAPTTAAPIQNTQKTQNTQNAPNTPNTPNTQTAQSAPNPPSVPKMPTTPPLPKAPSLSAIPKIPNLNGVGTSHVTAPAAPAPQSEVPAATPQNNPFTVDRFNDAWTGLKTYFGKEDSRLRNVVSFYQPVLHNQQSATLELPNQWELEEVKKALPRIHAYLHQQLKNDQLTLTLKVAQYTHEQKAFTAEERYKVMLEENAALNTLKEQFKLQID
ncbi:MAG: DNA polymerase III subunit gamma/tau [Paludibacteraceae bacterium]|nr:DNA polymerase III subunit gamma/tau [Paludibacteraceae bacterium]